MSYKRLVSKSWTDPEPDTFTMSVEVSNTDGRAYTVVSGCATWLTETQMHEVLDWGCQCVNLVKQYNLMVVKAPEPPRGCFS